MLSNILHIKKSEVECAKKSFAYYDRELFPYENRPKPVIHTLGSFENPDGSAYFQFNLVYSKELSQKVRWTFGEAAYFNTQKKVWEIKAIPYVFPPEELLNKLRGFTSNTKNIFLAPTFYDLVDKLKQLIKEDSNENS